MSQPIALRNMHATGNGRGPKVGWSEKPSMMLDENAGLFSPAYFNLTVPQRRNGKQRERSWCFLFSSF